MSAASNYTENNVINAALRGVAYPLPSNTYVSLHTANPGETGGGEVTTAAWPAYSRVEAEQGGAIGTGWSAPAGGDGQAKNNHQLTFPSKDGTGTITVTHWAIYDAPTGGNLIAYAPLGTARTLNTGDIFVFDQNAITVIVA